jgi:soluble lytic murein transglycosylase-like protein
MLSGCGNVVGSIGVKLRQKAIVAVVAAALLAGCSSTKFPGLANLAPAPAQRTASLEVASAAPVSPSSMDGLIAKWSVHYNVPEALIRRVIVRESGYNPRARNGPYYGLMQISYATAQSMGYRGAASGLLDADTNLKYAVKYLSGAYLVGRGNADQAVRNYSRGYYYDAKRAGLLEEVGLR